MNRKFQTFILITIACIGIVSCKRDFLEIPETAGTVDLDKVYSSSKNAEATLFSSYRNSLIHGWPGGWGCSHGALGSLCGERSRGWNWHGTYSMVESGLRTTDIDGAPAGADDFPGTWACIRAAFLVKENIDKVPDMTDDMKKNIKAECTALIAYRYMGMFYRYGGVPIVTKAFLPNDDMTIPRASLQETLDYILSLCDEAIAGLPDSWPAQYYGRFTKGAAMAIKARTLQFAARPLFNSAAPYLNFGGNNKLICFGSQDNTRWDKAIEANQAVLTWAQSNGYALINTGGGINVPNTNALNDYGTATSMPGNKEVLLAYKVDENMSNICVFYNATNYLTNYTWETELVGLLTNFLENYYAKDGTDPVWPKIGDPAPLPASHWLNNINNMEARFRLDYVVPGLGTLNNPGDPNWTIGAGWGKWIGNYTWDNDKFPSAVGEGRGCGAPGKFYYKAGSRQWFEPPLFRLAETYLNLAEAYNETGNSTKALENLNAIHNRAGLPSITETDQAKLRRIIWREKAIEFVGENQHYFDVKHWKHPDIANGIIGGQFRELQFQVQNSEPNFKENLISYWDANTNVGYWNPKMYLEPFPQFEVNKGIIVQNPGY